MGWLFQAARLRLVVAVVLVGGLLAQGFGGCVLNREGGLGARCSADSECDDGNPCTADSCTAQGSCANDPVDAPLGQTEGDCLVNLCRGGVIDVEPADDPEDDGEACTEDLCVDGQTVHDPTGFEGDSCQAPEGQGTCSGGTCAVLCQPGDACDDDQDCTEDFCNAQTGICDHSDAPDGPLPAAEQEEGDCRLRICSGGMASNVIDNLDLPEYPDEPCHFGICDNGTPIKGQLATGDPCSDPGDPLAQLCNAQGACVECIGPTNCPGVDTECRTRTCSPAGSCGEICTPNGTPLAIQAPGDCVSDVCDGNCMATEVLDPSDVPVDADPCTSDLCVNGTPLNPPAATGTPCGNGGVCNATGQCVGCNVAADCGNDSFCLSWTCTASSVCQPNFTPNDTPLPAAQQTPQDCIQLRCDGSGNVKQSPVNDPIVDGNPCTQDLCVNGSPQNPPSPLDQSCMATMYCDGNGSCVQCNNDGQCTSDDGVCEEDKCLANSCMIVFDPVTDPGPSNVLGDCLTLYCDGNGEENALPTVDDGDLPVDGNECTQDICTNGTPSNPPVPAGDPCSTGVCNGDASAPACVECASNADCAMGQICDTVTWTCDNGQGQGCVSPSDCFSGFCVDGVCCDGACAATCFACDLPGSVGSCSAVPFNVDVDNECAAGACDGMGACKLSDGQVCGAGGDCLSDECVDGVCCDGPCSGTCEACNISGSVGACAFVPFGIDLDNECAAGACDGAGQCKLDLGQGCGVPSQCLSNFCADGLCCDSACSGVCEACSAAGVCTPFANGTDPDNECNMPAADVCNGASACRCVDGQINGAETDTDCGGGTCGTCMNGQSCTIASDCMSGVCSGGTCQAPACGDGVVNGAESCDFNDPATPCCSTSCNGTAPSTQTCGADPDGTGCLAAPLCDGAGQAPANCQAAQNEPAGTLCTDNGVFCDGVEACDAGGSCVSPGDPCAGPDGDGDCAESCDEGADACTGPDPTGSTCDDGLWCNGADTCNASGQCSQHVGDPCPGPDGDGDCAESCDESVDMCTLNDGLGQACDDGLFCNGADTCDGGGMCATHAGDPCPAPGGDADCNQSCDEGVDMCTAYDGDGAACDDGLFCNGPDSCLGGTCSTSVGDPCPGPDNDPNCNESCDETADACTAYDGDGAACMQGMSTMCSGGTCSAM